MLSLFNIITVYNIYVTVIIFVQANFSRGLSIGTEDFSIDDLDPLKKWTD